MSDHLVNHIHNPELRSNNVLHVIGVVSNPARYHSRYRLARDWYDEMAATKNVKVYMVETAFGDRQHELTQVSPTHLQLRNQSEIWIKESMINLGVRHLLPQDWKYVAWVDADVSFRDPNWAQEALHQLQHFQVIQPWQQVANLGFRGNIMEVAHSAGWLRQMGRWPKEHLSKDWKKHHPSDAHYPYGHTGLAWCCTRGFWEQVQGLMWWAVLGSGDHHMAQAMVNNVDISIHGSMTDGFKKMCREWQYRAFRMTHGQIGYVHGRIEHNFHGAMRNRGYRNRWQLLIDHKFDPYVDLMMDAQGLIKLVGKPDLEDAIRQYNRSRGEDSIDEV